MFVLTCRHVYSVFWPGGLPNDQNYKNTIDYNYRYYYRNSIISNKYKRSKWSIS